MKAVRLNNQRELVLETLEKPVPLNNHVLVKVEMAGICGTDLSYWKFGSSRLRLPVTLGHEASGIIADVGQDVKNLKKGDRVIMTTTYKTCGVCKYCMEGNINLCINREGVGSKKNGYLAEFVEIPETSCILMPDKMDFNEGAFIELLSCAVHALYDKTSVNKDDVVVIFGPGPLGILVAQVAQLIGANVVLCGLSSDYDRFIIASECNIKHCLNLEEVNIVKYINNITNGYGADIVLECSGSYRAFSSAIELVRKKGTIVQLGLFHGEPKISDLSPLIFKEINLIGSISHVFDNWLKSIELINNKQIIVKPLISHFFKLEDYQEAFDISLRTESLKVMLKP